MTRFIQRINQQRATVLGLRGVLLFIIACLVLLLILPTAALAAHPRSEHIVYFPNTPHELNIYKIHGHHSGPTLMLIGGIQGNEPGGFLSADLYADIALERGNLIVYLGPTSTQSFSSNGASMAT